MHHHRPTPPRRLAAVALGFALLTAGAAVGEQLGSKDTVEVPFRAKKFQAFDKLMYGERPPTATDKETLDLAARYFLQRVTWADISASPEKLAEVHKEFESDFIGRTLNAGAKNRDFREQVGNAFARSAKPLLDQDFLENRIPVTTGAVMLPQIARLRKADRAAEKDWANMDEFGDLLAAVAADAKRHDVVRLYAAKGLREFFPVQPFTEDSDPKDPATKKKKERDVARVEALTKFIERDGAAEGPEADAARFLRREALEALGQAGAPAVAAIKRAGTAEGAVAPTLLKVLAGKGVVPPPGVAEKVEAAIGLCQFRYVRSPTSYPEYQPEPAVYLVGKAVEEFANEYSKDLVNLKTRKYPPAMAWKVQTRRLETALRDLAANAAGGPAKAQAESLQKAAQDLVFREMSAGNAIGQIQQFRAVVNAARPKSLAVFKTIKGPEIELP